MVLVTFSAVLAGRPVQSSWMSDAISLPGPLLACLGPGQYRQAAVAKKPLSAVRNPLHGSTQTDKIPDSFYAGYVPLPTAERDVGR